MRLKIAVLAPIPKPRMRTAVLVRRGTIGGGGVCGACWKRPVKGEK
jgi:hypothetical protein